MRLVDEGLGEAGALQIGGDGGEDGEHADDTVVCRGEQTAEEDADDEVQYLCRGA